MRKKTTFIAIVSMLILLIAVPIASAAVGVDTSELRDAVTVDDVRDHQKEFQKIANRNDGIRTSGTSGYDKSVEYVVEQLEATDYFDVEVQEFSFSFWEEFSTPVLEQLSPRQVSYPPNDVAGFFTMEFSGSGDVTATVERVDLILPPGPAANTSTSGCEAADFQDFTSGNIALIQRGTCTFALKAQNAEAAGATGVIIFNEGQPGRTVAFEGTLGGPGATVPVVGTAFAVGEELSDAGATVHMFVDAGITVVPSSNIVADTRTGRDDRVVVVGAHLDSVPAGPGINDNGSGSAVILEIALQMAELGVDPTNQVRFAWWGAEESGLIGSQIYVNSLSNRELHDIALNLNFDMVGSPNFVRFVYDGDGSDTPLRGPAGSANIEKVFLDYFAELGLPNEPTAFDGRSDYGPFIAVGIPAGGLFTGAEGIKTPDQAAVYGGTAGEQYDPCYHLACDKFKNTSLEALDDMSDASAHAVLTFAMTSSAPSGTARASGNAMKDTEMEFAGSNLQQ